MPLSTLKRLSRNQKGLTVTELLVALSILLLVLTVAYNLYYHVQTSWERGSRITQAQQNARLVIDRTVRELRQMQPSGSSGVAEADWDRVKFYLNIDGDDDLEQIEYVIVDGELRRRIYQLPYTASESETTVARDFANENQDGRRLFEYFQTSGGARLTNLSPSADDGPGDDLSSIRLIKVRVIICTGGYGEFTISSEVCPRNLGGT